MNSCGSLSTSINTERRPASFSLKSCKEAIKGLALWEKEAVEMHIVDGDEINIAPIKKYIRSSAINKKLRMSEDLSNEEQNYFNSLVESLSNLPPRNQKSIRQITINSSYNSLDDFLRKYQEGVIVEEKAFTSVGVDDGATVYGDILSPDIIIHIDGKTLRNVSDINKLENEGIFLPGIQFRVKKVVGDYEYSETIDILDEEQIEQLIQYYAKYLDKYDEYFSEVGVYAADVNKKFEDLYNVDFDEFTPVERNEWEDLIRQKSCLLSDSN